MSWLGRRIERRGVVASTNDEAAALARGGAPHGTVVVADAQTAGRGRHGRAWHSPAGESLYLSCVLRPDRPPREVPPITLAAGLGVVDAVNTLGVRASLKWPNDVVVGRRKLAGVLTEMSTVAQELDHVVLGIGVNVNADRFPHELAAIATSLRIETGQPTGREDLVRPLLPALERWLDAYATGGVDAIASAWTERAELSGRRVRAGAEGGEVVGEAVGLAADGALLVQDGEGHRHRVVSGDVVWV